MNGKSYLETTITFAWHLNDAQVKQQLEASRGGGT